ncbi:MAG: FAD-dependent oxidoreductase [Alphaproteobacteria bacterium]|nr:FAD-dependent oxidoreductase [Alphaproteobacteria bacterium]
MRIAVIGTGISGLSTAWLLNRDNEVTVFEAEDRLGGHSNTVDVDYDGVRLPVDTGFIVYNERTYPNLIAMFAELGVATERSDMSFAVSVDHGRLEYEGSVGGFTAQASNLVSARYWRMLRDLVRFYRTAPVLLDAPANDGSPTLGEYLTREGYGPGFIEDHLLPMAAAIWSCPAETMLTFPARSFVRFFCNHGLLDFAARPQWYTVTGGSREYVRRISAPFADRIRLSTPVRRIVRDSFGVDVVTDHGNERFDEVVVATHGDTALRLLDSPDDQEQEILSCFTYQKNVAVLHRDPTLMPRRKRLWASWNYLTEGRTGARDVAVTYWMNRLQNIDRRYPLFVSLNPLADPDPDNVFARFEYDHPVLDAAAVDAQARLPEIQGRHRTWFCGSYCGYGFHEDGLKAGIAVAKALGSAPPWTESVLPANGKDHAPSPSRPLEAAD